MNAGNSTSDSYPQQFKRNLFRGLGFTLLTFIVLSVLAVVSLRWLNPPTSSFMLQRQVQAWWNDEAQFEINYMWTDWEDISGYAKIAAITAEDQRFAEHRGIDFEQVEKAIEESKKGRDLRGASTITQQTAKNLFLWPAQNFIRKGFEAYFALLLELFWSKQRILEVYLNIAQFGEGIYGVQAASSRYFNVSAATINMAQSALLVTALPNPVDYNLANPSAYMLNRRNWNLQYMHYLGNRDYLKRIE